MSVKCSPIEYAYSAANKLRVKLVVLVRSTKPTNLNLFLYSSKDFEILHLFWFYAKVF